MIYAGTSPESVNELLKVTADEINKLISHVDEIELARIRAQVKSSLVMSYERSSYRSEDLGRHYTCYGRHITLEEIIEKFNKVTSMQVKEILKQIMNGSTLSMAAIGDIKNIMPHDELQSLYKF